MPMRFATVDELVNWAVNADGFSRLGERRTGSCLVRGVLVSVRMSGGATVRAWIDDRDLHRYEQAWSSKSELHAAIPELITRIRDERKRDLVEMRKRDRARARVFSALRDEVEA